ncbi:Dehydrodolichyl diphosphate synthase 3 [Dichanthelium oligosanthes]|uniref:Alkyl transferase n=1 Tax=Dichanthelium oligosanthes TaxID=888268 RepID=A0A1E5VG31_9POAL|nr:Dehydrodolichyl diphosphate synthase 3 [Dichanthelium oligosanthes]
MLSNFLSRTIHRTRLPDYRLQAGTDAAVAPPDALAQSGIRPESLPRHVAVVPDGNRRWAQARGLLTPDGHEVGRRALEHTMEVDYLMGMIERTIRENVDEYERRENGIRVHVIGDPSRWPESLQKTAREAEEKTRNNSKLHLMLATCYSGRWELVQACRALAHKVQGNLLRPEDIDESMLAGELQTSAAAGEFSCPDLVIRTSGEQRLSNFLLWQSAYSELYFTDTLWPDFGEAEYLQALSSFQSRERRFGQRTA